MGGVYVSAIKRKPLIGMTLKFGTVVVLNSLSKPIDFGFKRSMVRGSFLVLSIILVLVLFSVLAVFSF